MLFLFQLISVNSDTVYCYLFALEIHVKYLLKPMTRMVLGDRRAPTRIMLTAFLMFEEPNYSNFTGCAPVGNHLLLLAYVE